jgi:hypothetical protein
VPVELDVGGAVADGGVDADVEGAAVTDGAGDVGDGDVGVATWPAAVLIVLDAAWWPGNARLT